MSVRRLAMIVVFACVCVLGVGEASAWASEGYSASASGSLAAPPGGFVNPLGVAVNQETGDVYVSDYSSGMVDEFDASKEYVSQIAVPGGNPYYLGVDNSDGPSEGDVYVAGSASNVVYKFDALLDGSLVADATTPEIGGGVLSRPTGVAVDAAGDVYVVSEGTETVSKFSPTGQVLDADLITGVHQPEALAVNSAGDIYVSTDYDGTQEYGPSGACINNCASINGNEYQDRGLAITSQGDVLVSDQESNKVVEYGPGSQHQLIQELGSFELPFGIAVGETQHALYVADFVGKTVDTFEGGQTPEAPDVGAAEVKGTTVILHGTLNPGVSAKTEWYFAYNDDGGCGGGGTTPVEEAEGRGLSESREVSGLELSTTYTVCIVSQNKYGREYGSPVSFTTSDVGSESFSDVGQHGVTVSARLNTGGLATSYYVEYGLTSAYGSSTPVHVTGEGEGTVSVSARIEALQSYSEYHFRVVASSSGGAEDRGEDFVFRTLPAPINGLPDERVYEMVNPPDDLNMDVYRPPADYEFENNEGFQTEEPFQVAVSGSAIAYIGGATVGGTGKGSYGIQYLATRSAGGGWSQKTIEPDGREDIYSGFDNDLDVGALTTGVEQELSSLSALVPDKSYSMLYSCTDLSSVCRTPEETSRVDANEYFPLFTVKPPNRTGYAFGTDSNEVHGEGHPVFAGGSSGFASVLFEANDALIPGEGSIEHELAEDVKREVVNSEDHSYLYDSINGRLALIDVLPGTTSVPEGTVATHAMFGAAPFNNPHKNAPDFSNVISGDGDRVYWTELGSGSTEGRVFLRENPGMPASPVDSQGHCLVATDACTVPVSAGPARYWTSVEDGRLAFYTENGALYRFDAVTGVSEALTSSTAGVLGVTGVSEDGEVAYFVAEEAIGAVHGPGGTLPRQGEPNIYVSDHGTIGFVATLARTDGNEVEPVKVASGTDSSTEMGDWQPGLGFRTAEITPNGGGLLFMSSEKLKTVGFPNGVPNLGLQEVYLFQSESDELFCVSCSPSGETPPATKWETFGGPPAAAFVPTTRSNTYMFQWVSDSGDQVFFDSAEPLVPQDTNGKQDVYEWEREGSGSCVTGTGANGGCLYLLSSGSSEYASWLLGASANGENVFITTRSKLTPNDGDEAYNLFDVRAHGERPIEEGVCTGTGCQGAPAPPPTFATPPSVTFEGVGNFPPPTVSVKSGKSTKKTVVKCRKPKTRRDGRCVTAKHKSKAERKTRRSRALRSVVERHRRAA
jgi:hypothetical protein